MTRWGMTYPLEGIPLSEHKEVLQTAEDLGYTDAWSAEVNANDAFTPLAAFAAWTKKRPRKSSPCCAKSCPNSRPKSKAMPSE